MDDVSSALKYPSAVSSSPLLPLLLLSLARQKHAPDTASSVLSEYDYVIVGGGTAGSVMASRLSEVECVSVLLLEAGKAPPLISDLPVAAPGLLFSDVDWQYNTVPQKLTARGQVNRQVPWSSGKCLGGGSTLNFMFAIRGNSRNYDEWAELGATGWSYEDVLPYFLKLENYTDPEYLNNGYHNNNGPLTIENMRDNPTVRRAYVEVAKQLNYNFIDVNGPSQTGFYKLTKNTRDGQRCSAAKAYLVPADQRVNLDIATNAMVTKILIDRHRQATGVLFDHGGRTYEVRARREVIVSAGAAESPKLLMLSGIGPGNELRKFGIDVIADLPVGRNLQDHLGIPVNFVLDESKVTPAAKVVTNDTVLQYINTRTGPLTLAFGAILTSFLKNPHSTRQIPDYQTIIFEPDLEGMKKAFGIDHQFFEEIYGPYRNKPTYVCFSITANPKTRGIVRLKSTNPYDSPIVDPKYFEDPVDMDDSVAAMKNCLEFGNSGPLRRLGTQPFQTVYPGCESYPLYGERYLKCMAGTIGMTVYHKCCSVRMGNYTDPLAVLDPELRVKTISNLRVVDASVMPTIPAGNTNLPVMMVAEKAADMVKRSIACAEDTTSGLLKDEF